MEKFWINVFTGISSGLLLAFLLFLLKEYIFGRKNLTGRWNAKLLIEKTSYNLYKDLEIYYEFHLLQKGYELSGSGEKIKEIDGSGNTTKYERDKRVTIDIEGYYEHKYLRKSKIFLNIIENGRSRESRKTYSLELVNKQKLSGEFVWTAADSEGEVSLVKFS